MDYSTILRDNLLSAIEELKKKNNISSTNYYIHVCPDVSEKELSRILSTDLYYRERFINGAYETKSFNVDEFVKGVFRSARRYNIWLMRTDKEVVYYISFGDKMYGRLAIY